MESTFNIKDFWDPKIGLMLWSYFQIFSCWIFKSFPKNTPDKTALIPTMNLLSIFIVFVVICQVTNSLNSSCETTSHLDLSNTIELDVTWAYEEIDNVEKLKIKCDVSTYFDILVQTSSLGITFDFKNSFHLNRTIDLNPFSFINTTIYFTFSNLNGIDIETSGPIFSITPAFEGADYDFSFANLILAFYYKGELIDQRLCDMDLLGEIDVNLFSNLSSVAFSGNMNIKPVCPYVFRNAHIELFILDSFEMDLVQTRGFQFLKLKNADNYSLHARFNQIRFVRVFHFVLDHETLNSMIFESVRSLDIGGYLRSIESDVFKSFNHITALKLELSNIFEFLHSSDNSWMSSLFHQGRLYQSKQEMVDDVQDDRRKMFFLGFTETVSHYEYPDEDICLFKYFPGNKAILTLIQFSSIKDFFEIGNRTDKCTMKFLCQNTKSLDHLFTYFYSADSIQDFDQSQLDECDFEYRLSLCPNSSDYLPLGPTRHYSSYYDTVYVFKWLDFIGPVVTFPIFALLGFALNLITILVIRSKKNKAEKLFEARLFKYILMNSIFNCLECFIYQLRLVNICISPGAIYCSSIKNTSFGLAIGTYINIFLAESLKTCSILTGLLFSLERYSDTSKTKNKFIVWCGKISIKRIIFLVISASIISTASLIVQPVTDTHLPLYDTPVQFSINFYVENSLDKFVAGLIIIHYILNDFVLLLVNLIVDLKLVCLIKADLKQKIKFSGSQASNQKLLKKSHSVQNKANYMIIINMVIYLFCRMPELASRIYFLLNERTDTLLYNCSVEIFCYLLANTIEYLYMLSYSFNLIIYYNFISSFRAGFRQFFGRKAHKAP